jgi:hypothetical protein
MKRNNPEDLNSQLGENCLFIIIIEGKLRLLRNKYLDCVLLGMTLCSLVNGFRGTLNFHLQVSSKHC